jgi:hypothetical protein
MHTHTLEIYLYDSSICILMGCGLDGQGSIADRGKIFLFAIVSRPAVGPTHPPAHWVPCALSLGEKQWWRETVHLPLFSAEVENGGAFLHSSKHLHCMVFNNCLSVPIFVSTNQSTKFFSTTWPSRHDVNRETLSSFSHFTFKIETSKLLTMLLRVCHSTVSTYKTENRSVIL